MYAFLHQQVQKDTEQTVYASYPREGKTFHFYFYALLYSLNFFSSEEWKMKFPSPSAHAPASQVTEFL